MPRMAENYRSVPEMFLDRVKKSPDAPAFHYAKGTAWETINWKQTGERVRQIRVRAEGARPQAGGPLRDLLRHAIEWILADVGILCAGGATTTIYPSNSGEDCAYILQDSGTVIAFVGERRADQEARDEEERDSERSRARHVRRQGQRGRLGDHAPTAHREGEGVDEKNPQAWDKEHVIAVDLNHQAPERLSRT